MWQMLVRHFHGSGKDISSWMSARRRRLVLKRVLRTRPCSPYGSLTLLATACHAFSYGARMTDADMATHAHIAISVLQKKPSVSAIACLGKARSGTRLLPAGEKPTTSSIAPQSAICQAATTCLQIGWHGVCGVSQPLWHLGPFWAHRRHPSFESRAICIQCNPKVI